MNKKTFTQNYQKGQALLTIIFLMVIGMTVIVAASSIFGTGVLSTSTAEQGEIAYYNAESGAEDGILHLLRNPLLSGTVPSISQDTVSITNTIQTNNTATITSVGIYANAVRKIQVQLSNSSGKLTVTSWREIN